MADFPSKFANWQVHQLHSAAEIEYDVAANWKLILQNYSECLHCPSVHPALARLSPPTSGANDPPNSCYLGVKMSLNDGIQTMTFSGSSHRPNLPVSRPPVMAET
ncbi:MAG: SRPBCC family protein [Betaproteobacteria bacterium]